MVRGPRSPCCPSGISAQTPPTRTSPVGCTTAADPARQGGVAQGDRQNIGSRLRGDVEAAASDRPGLAVGSIVEASVQVVGNRLRVAVQLLDPVTQAELWAERYDRTLDDAFAVQSDIARQIVAAVGATLTVPKQGPLGRYPRRTPRHTNSIYKGSSTSGGRVSAWNLVSHAAVRAGIGARFQLCAGARRVSYVRA